MTTQSEVMQNLNGFDEIAIAKYFDGLDVLAEINKRPTVCIRALVFADLRHRHDGTQNDEQHYQQAMSIGMLSLPDYFDAEDDDEPIEDDLDLDNLDTPSTASGKDNTEPPNGLG